MEVTFYNFKKRRDSTARPSGGTAINVLLKDNTTMLEPSLELRLDSKPTWNYFYIPDFKRYYTISDISYFQGLWTISGRVDVLATYKSDIQSGVAFVNYASSRRNADIIDSRIFPLPTYQTAITGFSPAYSSSDGTYILRCIGKDSTFNSSYRLGMSQLYLLNTASMVDFVNQLNTSDVWDQIINYFKLPMDGIIECFYLPFTIYGDGDNYCTAVDSSVYIGNTSIDCGAKVITNTLGSFPRQTYDITIPWRYDDFRNNSPYSAMFLYTPWTGVAQLNVSDFYGKEKLKIDYALDVSTGDISFNIIDPSTARIVTTLSGSAKVSLPISQITVNVGGELGAAAATVGGAVALGTAVFGEAAALPAVGALVGGAFGVMTSAAQTNINSRGSMSGSLNAYTLGDVCQLVLVQQDTLVDPSNNASIGGYPLGAVTPLASLSGYVQTSNASIDIEGFDSEKSELNGMLNSGIYIE